MRYKINKLKFLEALTSHSINVLLVTVVVMAIAVLINLLALATTPETAAVTIFVISVVGFIVAAAWHDAREYFFDKEQL